MTNTPVITTPKQAVPSVELFRRDDIKAKFVEVLGKRGNAFTSSILTLIGQDEKLKACNPNSIYMSAMMAATLDLPINKNLGFAFIIPYGNEATFQMGYKGYKQLAMRSGQVKTMNAAPIYKDQIVSQNPLKGYEFDFSILPQPGEKPCGYAAYIELLNGFEKTFYMTVEEVTEHGKKYSQTFKKGFGHWVDNFDKQALKTVTKLLLNSGDVPLSVEMQQAIIADQAVIRNTDTMEVEYKDVTDKFEITLEAVIELYEEKKAYLPATLKSNAERIIQHKEEANYEKLYNELKEFKSAAEAKNEEKKDKK